MNLQKQQQLIPWHEAQRCPGTQLEHSTRQRPHAPTLVYTQRCAPYTMPTHTTFNVQKNVAGQAVRAVAYASYLQAQQYIATQAILFEALFQAEHGPLHNVCSRALASGIDSCSLDSSPLSSIWRVNVGKPALAARCSGRDEPCFTAPHNLCSLPFHNLQAHLLIKPAPFELARKSAP
jgi:hypothetical protein